MVTKMSDEELAIHMKRLEENRKRKAEDKANVEELYNGGYNGGYAKIIEEYNLHDLDTEGTIFVYNKEEDAKKFLLDCILNGREWDFLPPKLFIIGYGNNHGEYKNGNDIWNYLRENDKVLIYSDLCIIGWAKISHLNKEKLSVNFSDGEILPYLNLKCLMEETLPKLFINNHFKEDRSLDNALDNFGLIFRGKSIIKLSNDDIRTILEYCREGHPCLD